MLTSLETIKLIAPAKINLFLNVEDKRSDGYHNIFTVICSVSLYDYLSFSFQERGLIYVVCKHPKVPEGRFNLVYKAIRLFFKELGKLGFNIGVGVSVYIEKNIPVGSGFGGGSSNAACTLLLLNRRFGFPFSSNTLINIAKKLGADVPFFIFGRPAIASGIGDHLTVFTQSLPKFAVLVYTGLVVSTSWVYKKLRLSHNLRLTKAKKKIKKSISTHTGDFNCRSYLLNDLESVTRVEFPIINEVKIFLSELGAIGTLMSGSGSGVFGLFKDIETAISASRSLLIDHRSKDWLTYVVRLLS